jgi:hypothetical protein
MKFPVLVTLLLLTAAAPSQDATPAQRLQRDHPKVKWNLASRTSVDIDCDGRADNFYWGIEDNVVHTFFIGGKHERHAYSEVVLGFERAAADKTQSQNIPFLKNTGYYGFCAAPDTIEVHPLSCAWEGSVLPGCSAAKKCESLWVKNSKCGEFYVYWDATRREVNWVRH